MGFLGWICFGFFAGLVARALLPGDQPMGFVKTTLLGVAGSFVGGFVATLIFGGNWQSPEPAGFVGAVLGAMGLLALVAGMRKRRR